ncbi:hypothetical protein [Aeromonas veronii]|uniref:hypothetical protein n=1 Tax=Aeromonas veronii TaxID=654 RepID=UPI0032EE98E4
MKKWVMMLAAASLLMSLAGCIVVPPGGHDGAQQGAEMITRDGVTLPDCGTLPDASQADNGSRCWYR